MTDARSDFLTGALRWLHGDDIPDVCPDCGWEWSAAPEVGVAAIGAAPDRYDALLDGRDGMVPAADGGWNATAYLWHLTDLARSWAERWVQLRSMPGSRLAGWDPDELAAARNYRGLPTVSARWALREAVATFVEESGRIDVAVTFEHGDWGTGTVADGIRWMAHEFVHHQLDVADRVR